MFYKQHSEIYPTFVKVERLKKRTENIFNMWGEWWRRGWKRLACYHPSVRLPGPTKRKMGKVEHSVTLTYSVF